MEKVRIEARATLKDGLGSDKSAKNGGRFQISSNGEMLWKACAESSGNPAVDFTYSYPPEQYHREHWDRALKAY
jgi:hypothetical protein